MKKIIFTFLVIINLILFTSCGSGKSQRAQIFDEPETTLSQQLKLDSVKNGVSLNSSLDKNKAYYDVKIANDASSTLFYTATNIDSYLNDRLSKITVSMLKFNTSANVEYTGFINEMNNKDYGLSESKIGYDFTNDNNSFMSRIALSQTLSIPNDYKANENDSAVLVVVYLPVYCVYNDGSQDYNRVFLMVPVYYEFTNQSKVDAASVAPTTIDFTENGLLPSLKTE